MSKEKLRACAVPGLIMTKRSNGKWYRSSIDKKHCGTVVRITSLGPGDVRMMGDVVILAVRNREFAVPIKNIRIKRERYR